MDNEISTYSDMKNIICKKMANDPNLSEIQTSWEMADKIISDLQTELNKCKKEYYEQSDEYFALKSKADIEDSIKRIKKSEKDYLKRQNNNNNYSPYWNPKWDD